MLTFEQQHWHSGHATIAGVDEAGRGPLAGPVVAASVIFDRAWVEAEQHGVLKKLNDSKQLSEKLREHFFTLLTEQDAVTYGVGQAEADEVDRINILQATYEAMRRAVNQLPAPPDLILVDGKPVPDLPHPSENLIKGDSRSLSIAAASIIAKVTRDRQMLEYAQQYPVYGFDQHKGYGTKRHLDALNEHGPCPIHRTSFKPVSQLRLF
jgi:ribonuclease HII